MFRLYKAAIIGPFVLEMRKANSSRNICSCSKAVYKPVMSYTIGECTVNKLLMMADELSETCTVSRQNKFVKLVHLVGFITKKCVLMGHIPTVTEIKFTRLFPLFIPNSKIRPYPCWKVLQLLQHAFISFHS
jgi:hypothetical protein